VHSTAQIQHKLLNRVREFVLLWVVLASRRCFLTPAHERSIHTVAIRYSAWEGARSRTKDGFTPPPSPSPIRLWLTKLQENLEAAFLKRKENKHYVAVPQVFF